MLYGHFKDARKHGDPLNMRGRRRRIHPAIAILAIGASVLTLSYCDRQIRDGEQRRDIIVERAKYVESPSGKRLRFNPIILATTVFLTSGTSWTIPADLNSITQVDGIGGGGTGQTVNTPGTANGGGAGGGGGAFARKLNPSFTRPTTPIVIGSNGVNTTFNTSVMVAQSGSGITAGTAASSTGDSKASGGQGGNGGGSDGNNGGGGGGGGGAGGPTGSAGSPAAGAAGSSADPSGAIRTGGNGGKGDGTAGGNGSSGGASGTTAGNASNGTEYDASHGSGGGGGGGGGAQVATSGGGNGGSGGLYGGGGGGGGGPANGQLNGSGVAGGGGLIVVTYTPFAWEPSGPAETAYLATRNYKVTTYG